MDSEQEINLPDELRKLQALYDVGALTSEELSRAKGVLYTNVSALLARKHEIEEKIYNTLSDADWQDVDAMIYTNHGLTAIKRYKELTGVGLNVAVEAVHQRRDELVVRFPERFKSEAQYRAEALNRLEAIRSKIVAIESVRNGDDWCYSVDLYAITEEPSRRHPKYTRKALCYMVCIGLTKERALALGSELARITQTPLYNAEFAYGEDMTSNYSDMFSSQEEMDRWYRGLDE